MMEGVWWMLLIYGGDIREGAVVVGLLKGVCGLAGSVVCRQGRWNVSNNHGSQRHMSMPQSC